MRRFWIDLMGRSKFSGLEMMGKWDMEGSKRIDNLREIILVEN